MLLFGTHFSSGRAADLFFQEDYVMNKGLGYNIWIHSLKGRSSSLVICSWSQVNSPHHRIII